MRKTLNIPTLKLNYISKPKAFSRNRKLPFLTVVGLIFQKSSKSLQIKLNEFFCYIESETASAGAFSQARVKLSHELFIDLNRDCYNEVYYEEHEYERYRGYRLLAIDGSKIRLPDERDVRDEFGNIKIKNQYGSSSYTGALASVIYDVLNENALEGVIDKGNSSEITLAKQHLELCQEKDLLLLDRNYPGYELFFAIKAKNADFIARCSKNAFGVVKDFLANQELEDTIVTLSPSKDLASKVKSGHLPEQMRIRLVKVVLSTGELEILATSILNQDEYSIEDFYELYGLRWGVETFYDRVKNRLCLENFTGKTAESVKQDFYVTILLANIESEISIGVNQELEQEHQEAVVEEPSKVQYKHKVNKSISYNAIKEKAFELLFCPDLELEELTSELEKLFKKYTIPIRPNRNVDRKTTHRRSLNFHLRRRKTVF